MSEKRKRSPNWLPSEKNLLLDIVEQHFNIVENKKTDGASIKLKNAEWITISKEYNSQTTHSYRNGENLKSQWESMKKAVKKESSKIKMHLLRTGQEPPKSKTEDVFYNRILSLIGSSDIGFIKPEVIVIQEEHAREVKREEPSLHDITMQIKHEELKIKQEELKQNKIKTRLLLLELRLKRKQQV